MAMGLARSSPGTRLGWGLLRACRRRRSRATVRPDPGRGTTDDGPAREAPMTLDAQPRPDASASLEGLVITDSRTGMRAVLERVDERGGTGFEVLYELP